MQCIHYIINLPDLLFLLLHSQLTGYFKIVFIYQESYIFNFWTSLFAHDETLYVHHICIMYVFLFLKNKDQPMSNNFRSIQK